MDPAIPQRKAEQITISLQQCGLSYSGPFQQIGAETGRIGAPPLASGSIEDYEP
jgi:hypothetical protein